MATQFNYRTQEQRLSIFLTAIKANTICKKQRQDLNLVRATPVGKFIQPEIAKQSAIRVIDCFNRVHNIEAKRQEKSAAIECLKNGGSCEDLINKYVIDR